MAGLLLLLERIPALRRQAVGLSSFAGPPISGLALAGALVASTLFPASITDVALDLDGGIVGNLQLPLIPEAILLFLFWDFWRYWQHRVFHEVPLLWRAHLVHHSDTAIDVTTSQRHHPFEGIIVTVTAFILIFALGIFSGGARYLPVCIHTVCALSATPISSCRKLSIDRLRAWLVTPAVHAMHHSSYQPETDSNYGAVLTIWDRMFGTYTAPGNGPTRFGLEYFRGPKTARCWSTLLQPLVPNSAQWTEPQCRYEAHAKSASNTAS